MKESLAPRDGRAIRIICDCGFEHIAVLFHLEDETHRIEWFCNATLRVENLTHPQYALLWFDFRESKEGKDIVTYADIQSAKDLTVDWPI